MDNMFQQNTGGVDTRRKRRFYNILKKIKRISAVILIWMAGGLILYGVYTIVFVQPYFEVERVEVEGNLRMLSREQVIALTGINIGDHLLRIPVGVIQKKLMETPWIKEAAVHRKLPHMVWIYVNEYVPEAILRTDALYYIDRSGNMFKKLTANDKKDFPVITGLEEIAKSGSNDELRSKIAEILGVKRLFETSTIGETYGLSEIHYSDNKGISVITLNDPMELRLGFGPFAPKMERLETVHKAMRAHGGVIAYIDLNSEGKVVVKYI